jgi:hypothetical protein
MKFIIPVEIEITPDDPEQMPFTDADLKTAAEDAIQRALEAAEDMGFSHQLDQFCTVKSASVTSASGFSRTALDEIEDYIGESENIPSEDCEAILEIIERASVTAEQKSDGFAHSPFNDEQSVQLAEIARVALDDDSMRESILSELDLSDEASIELTTAINSYLAHGVECIDCGKSDEQLHKDNKCTDCSLIPASKL